MTRTTLGDNRNFVGGEPATSNCVAIGYLRLAIFTVAVFSVPGLLKAEIISLFNFNDMAGLNNGTTLVTVDNAVGTPTMTLVEDGGLLADLNGQAGVAFVDANSTNHVAGMSVGWTSGLLSTSTNPNDSWLLNVDTTGYSNLALRFDYRMTLTTSGEILQGPTMMTLDWSAGGGPFTTLQTYNLTRDNAFHVFSLDLSGIAEIQNATNVQLRGTWSNDGSDSVPTNGTFPSARMDNLQLTGVPEPASITLCAMIAAVGLMRRRR